MNCSLSNLVLPPAPDKRTSGAEDLAKPRCGEAQETLHCPRKSQNFGAQNVVVAVTMLARSCQRMVSRDIRRNVPGLPHRALLCRATAHLVCAVRRCDEKSSLTSSAIPSLIACNEIYLLLAATGLPSFAGGLWFFIYYTVRCC